MMWEKCYGCTPDSVKEIGKKLYSLLPLEVRWGRRFFQELQFLEKSQWWSLAELEAYQNEKLRELIRHAYDNVPYYQDLLKNAGLTPADIKTHSDLPKIPVLTKDLVRANLNRLIARNIAKRDICQFSTSGTTGKPLYFYFPKKREYFNFGHFMWRHYRWAGENFSDLKVLMTNWILKPGRGGQKQIFKHNPARNLLIFSSYDINKKNAPIFAEALRRYQPIFIEAFPSSLEMLVKFFMEEGIERPVRLKAVFLNSETLYPWQRELFQNYFGCLCFNNYALEERVVQGVECEAHTHLHLSSEYGVTEFVRDGRPVPVGEKGEIVATSLLNDAMPFIRYQTGDEGRQLSEPCSCGRGLALMELFGGRTRNFVVSKRGSLISVTVVDIPNVSDKIEQFQFYQDTAGYLELAIVKMPGFGDKDLGSIRRKLKEKFTDDMDIDIKLVDEIKAQVSAKRPLLIQKLKV